MSTPTQANGTRGAASGQIPPLRPRSRKTSDPSPEETARVLSQMGSWGYRWKSAVRSWVSRLLS